MNSVTTVRPSRPRQPARLKRLAPVLMCPRTGGKLTYRKGTYVAEAGEQFEIVDGKPILVRVVSQVNRTPPSKAIISKNSASFAPPDQVPEDADIVLHLGCGDVPSDDPRVISVDVLPTAAADIVAEAEALPFADESIDCICSDAVFEHIPDPFAAIAECKRVLKPGGLWFTNTAFMQGFHGYPSHYFNMTLQAAERYFADDFELIGSGVPKSGSPAYMIRRVLRWFIHGLPPEQASRFMDMTLREVHDVIDADIRSGADRICAMLSDSDRRAFAASVKVVARKPADYAARKASLLDSFGADEFEALKKSYYEKRQSLIERFGLVEMYRRRAEPHVPAQAVRVDALPPLSDALDEAVCRDPLDPASWHDSIARLDHLHGEAGRNLRFWMRAYQASPAAESGNQLK